MAENRASDTKMLTICPCLAGKRRRTSLTFQGRFKQPLSMEAVVSGQEFFRPAQNLPAKWLVDTVLIQV